MAMFRNDLVLYGKPGLVQTEPQHASVTYYEAEVTKIDAANKVVYMDGDSDITGSMSGQVVSYDMLVVGVGAENATFGIPGVKEHGCFLKEVGDAQKDVVHTVAMQTEYIAIAVFSGSNELLEGCAGGVGELVEEGLRLGLGKGTHFGGSEA